MKAKLIKLENGIFHLWLNVGTKDADHIASNEPLVGEWGRNLLKYKLSLKNCQAIGRGYDLGELTEEEVKLHHTLSPKAFKRGIQIGFQKALEILGDKKFSDEDIREAFAVARHIGKNSIAYEFEEWFDRHMKQQTEWDVDIEMEEVAIGDKYTPEPKPKLDADGCLILKRVI